MTRSLALHPLSRWLALAVCLLCGAFDRPARALAEEAVTEDVSPLAVTIDGRDERLEALIVRPTGAGRFPIALIVNGHSDTPKDLHPSGIAHLAHDFAHRGWLAAVVGWRGYGLSSGEVQERDAGSCQAPTPGRYLDAHAADLAAALTALRGRPDADPTIAVGLGISIGGASMLDLAAGAGRPLAAVIDISGGLHHHSRPFMPDPTCGPFEADLIRTIGTYGAAHVPTLWIYSENDPWFRPSLVRAMAQAYWQNGGIVDVKMLQPFGDDGHTLFRWEANLLTQPLIDAFLRQNHLPAMVGDEDVAILTSGVGPDDRDQIASYLRMPTEKALAISDEGREVFVSFAKRTLKAARDEAMARCMAASHGSCHVAAENRATPTRP